MSETTRATIRQTCLDLVHADDENQVLRILERHGFDDPAHWRPLGEIENNLSIVDNQQSCATAAIVEKLINGIDATLLLECRQRGIDPESALAPATMADAAATF